MCVMEGKVQTSYNLNRIRKHNTAKRMSHACMRKNQILRVLACVIPEWIYSCWIIISGYFKVINGTLYVRKY